MGVDNSYNEMQFSRVLVNNGKQVYSEWSQMKVHGDWFHCIIGESITHHIPDITREMYPLINAYRIFMSMEVW
jgi:hypothetical protein